ncbi:MAG: hypothetical protein AABW64_01490 [Nanoarchaeota archaeon]
MDREQLLECARAKDWESVTRDAPRLGNDLIEVMWAYSQGVYSPKSEERQVALETLELSHHIPEEIWASLDQRLYGILDSAQSLPEKVFAAFVLAAHGRQVLDPKKQKSVETVLFQATNSYRGLMQSTAREYLFRDVPSLRVSA